MGFFSDLFGTSGPDFTQAQLLANQVRGEFDRFEELQRGVELGVTDDDRQFASDTIGFAGDEARQQLQDILPEILASARGNVGARGIGGSGIEARQESRAATDAAREVGNILRDTQRQTATALPQLAHARAGMELGRNQQLFNSLLASFQPSFDIESQRAEAAQQQRQTGLGAIGSFFGPVGSIVGEAIADRI